uniref:G protein-coupled receptor n=1 Tax=Ascaris lumbricoides TaxID=6252 RepID=A0A0M3ICM3_ASCLU
MVFNGSLSASLYISSLIVNIAFVVEASRERHSRKFLLGLAFLYIFHQLTILDNPIEYMSISFRSALVAQQSIFVTHIIWAIDVVLALSRYFAVVIISLSRMVAQTFNIDMQIKVWSSRVCAFAIFAQFAFPISYVCAFVLDRPKLLLQLHANSLIIIWGNEALHKQYKQIGSTIVVVLFIVAFIAYSIIFIKKLLMKKHRRQQATRDVEWIVHAVRSDPESEDSSEGRAIATNHIISFIVILNKVTVIPHNPTVAPYFVYRELHFTMISFITLLIYVYQWIANEVKFLN